MARRKASIQVRRRHEAFGEAVRCRSETHSACSSACGLGEATSWQKAWYPTALIAVDCKARTREQAQKWVTSGQVAKSVCALDSCEYFRLERCHVSGPTSTASGFAIVVVLDGKISLATSKSDPLELF